MNVSRYNICIVNTNESLRTHGIPASCALKGNVQGNLRGIYVAIIIQKLFSTAIAAGHKISILLKGHLSIFKNSAASPCAAI